MKGSKAFMDIIKAYLDEFAKTDEVFAEKYQNRTDKSIEDCCSFIASQVQKMGVCGLDDNEVFGLAIHYFDEDNLHFDKIQYDVVCNHAIELTEEEKTEAKAEALRQYQQKMYDEYLKKSSKKKESDPSAPTKTPEERLQELM